jgi:branched-chain amino acid transport system substrate-binding protein
MLQTKNLGSPVRRALSPMITRRDGKGSGKRTMARHIKTERRECGSGQIRALFGATGLAAALVLAGSLTARAGEVTVGQSTSLSGSIAQLGITGQRGITMALDKINAEGGLLGQKVRLVVADDGMTPANGTTNARQMILSDHIKALFGPVSSAVGAAEETLAAQYRIPYFLFTSNDVRMTTQVFTPYVFQVVPNTVMEPRAVARYLAELVGKKPITVAVITPNYSFGRDSADSFIAALKAYGVDVKVLTQQFPKLGETDYTPYIPPLVAAHADYVFVGQYGGDLITFTKQALGFGLFKVSTVVGQYGRQVLTALAGQVPAGTIAFDRAPYWAMEGEGVKRFTEAYHTRFHEWPSAWAILGYTAVETWAAGVKKAGDFDGDKLVTALSGATVQTIRGPITLRACDHQGNVAEYVGRVSREVDPRYGQQIYTDVKAIPGEETMLTCEEAQKLQPRH